MFAAVFSPPWMRWALTSQSIGRLVVSMQNLVLFVHCSVAGAENDITRIPDSMCEFLFFSLLLWFFSLVIWRPLGRCLSFATMTTIMMRCKAPAQRMMTSTVGQFQNLYRDVLSNTVFTFEREKKRRSRITQWGQKTASNEFISLLRTDLFQRLLQLEFT